MFLPYPSLISMVAIFGNLVLVSSQTALPGRNELGLLNIRCVDEQEISPPSSNQRRCAKENHGGADLNAGAYGFRSPEHSALFPNGWPVRFQPEGDNSIYTNARFRLFCVQRCWSHVTETAVLTRQQYSLVARRLKDTVIVRADFPRNQWYEVVPVPADKGNMVVSAIELQIVPETASWWQRGHLRAQSNFVALHPDNHITCTSNVPNFPIPGPFPNEYQSMQRLCATALNGGHQDANMGGVCIPRKDNRPPYVNFENNLAPSTDLIPDSFAMITFGRNTRIQLIRLRCFYDCSCASEQAEPRLENELINVPWMYKTKMAPTSNGVRIVSLDGNQQITTTIQNDGTSGEQCSSTGCQPMDEYGVSKFLSNSARPLRHCDNDEQTCSLTEQELYQKIKLPSSPSCGNKCDGAGGCSMDCPRCRVGKPLAEQVGQGLTRLMIYAASWCAPLPSRPNRGLLPRDDETLDEGPCACNNTYVSMACCDARDGFVLEAADMKRGQLWLKEEM